MKTVTITKIQICAVQTLSEWLEQRIEQIQNSYDMAFAIHDKSNMAGRLTELKIIREKLDDGRIQNIGETQFKGAKL